jgi:hypothetical protein
MPLGESVAFNDSPVLKKGYNPGPIHRKRHHVRNQNNIAHLVVAWHYFGHLEMTTKGPSN